MCLNVLPLSSALAAIDPQLECLPGNIVANGSFETPVVDPILGNDGGTWDSFPDETEGLEWYVSEASDDSISSELEIQSGYAGWLAAEGEQFAELDSTVPTIIGQRLLTTPGAEYTLSFAFSARPDTAIENNAVEVFWNGDSLGVITTDAAISDNTAWSTYTFTVTAAGDGASVAFADRGTPADGFGTFLDNVSVTCNQGNSGLQGIVYNDVDGDGVHPNGIANRLDGIEVSLYNESFEFIRSSVTGVETPETGPVLVGQFKFNNLTPAFYHVCVEEMGAGYQQTSPTEGYKEPVVAAPVKIQPELDPNVPGQFCYVVNLTPNKTWEFLRFGFEPIEVVPGPGTLTVVKEVVNSDASVADFTYTIQIGDQDAIGPVAFEEGGTGYIIPDGAAFSVVESDYPTYQRESSEFCTGVMAAEADLTCTITNTYTPQVAPVTIFKTLPNDNGGTETDSDFVFNVYNRDGSPAVTNAVSGVPFNYFAGDYILVESWVGDHGDLEIADWYDVTYEGDCYEDVDGIAHLVVLEGEETFCTIVNDDKPATITVTKLINGGPAVSASDFSLAVEGADVFVDQDEDLNTAPLGPVSEQVFQASATGIDLSLDAGDFLLYEIENPDYLALISEGCESGTLTLGQHLDCTITNTYIGVSTDNAIMQGIVYADVDGDGVHPGGETNRLDGVTISLYNETFGFMSSVVTGTETDDTGPLLVGQYRFMGLPAGVYHVCAEDMGAGFRQTSPADGYKEPLVAAPVKITSEADPNVAGQYCYRVELAQNRQWKYLRFGFEPLAPVGNLNVTVNVQNDEGGVAEADDFTVTITDTVGDQSVAGSETGIDAVVTGAFSTDLVGDTTGYTVDYSDDCAGDMTTGGDLACVITLQDTELFSVTASIIPHVVCVEDVGEGMLRGLFGYTSSNPGPVFIQAGTFENRFVGGGLLDQDQGQPSTFETDSMGDYTEVIFAGSIPLTWTIVSTEPNSVTADANSTYCDVMDEELGPTTITLRKTLIQDNGAVDELANFAFFIDGTEVALDTPIEVTPDVFHVITEEYVVEPTEGEQVSDRYVTTFSNDCINGEFIVRAGDEQVCDITNDDVAGEMFDGSLTINVVVVGGDAPEDGFGLYLNGVQVDVGAPTVLPPGDYTVFEDIRSGYESSFSGDCVETSINNAVGNIASDEDAICTITNTFGGLPSGGGSSSGGSTNGGGNGGSGSGTGDGAVLGDTDENTDGDTDNSTDDSTDDNTDDSATDTDTTPGEVLGESDEQPGTTDESSGGTLEEQPDPVVAGATDQLPRTGVPLAGVIAVGSVLAFMARRRH